MEKTSGTISRTNAKDTRQNSTVPVSVSQSVAQCALPSTRVTYTDLTLIVSHTAFYAQETTLPTVEDLKNVWILPEEGSDDFERKKTIAVWCWVHVLPAAVPLGHFNDPIKFYSLPTDCITVCKQNVFRVTITAEAFGLLLFENGRQKWLAKLDYMRKLEIPSIPSHDKKKPETHKWKAVHQDFDNLTKWTDANAGQGKGWSTKAVGPHNRHWNAVKDFRQEDKKCGHAVLRKVLGWAKEVHRKPGETPPKGRRSNAQPAMQEQLEQDSAPVKTEDNHLTIRNAADTPDDSDFPDNFETGSKTSRGSRTQRGVL